MRRGILLPAFAILGFVFLYAPILSLIIFSFNESQLVTVWGGAVGPLFADGFEDGTTSGWSLTSP